MLVPPFFHVINLPLEPDPITLLRQARGLVLVSDRYLGCFQNTFVTSAIIPKQVGLRDPSRYRFSRYRDRRIYLRRLGEQRLTFAFLAQTAGIPSLCESV